MGIDVNMILVIALVASIVANIVISYFGYKVFVMMLRAIAPSLRHPRTGTQPIPPLSLGHQMTDSLEESFRNG